VATLCEIHLLDPSSRLLAQRAGPVVLVDPTRRLVVDALRLASLSPVPDFRLPPGFPWSRLRPALRSCHVARVAPSGLWPSRPVHNVDIVHRLRRTGIVAVPK
jgi:hypothetical protein